MKIALRIWIGFLLFAFVLYATTGICLFGPNLSEARVFSLLAVYGASAMLLIFTEQ